MVGEKFFHSISSLTSSELNACIRFSMNETFNKRVAVIKTVKLFKQQKESFFLLLKDEEKTFKKIFGSKTEYNKKVLTDHFYYSLLFVESFIVFSEIQKNKNRQLDILENFYKERGVQKEAEAINAKRIKLTNCENISIKSYLNLYNLHINRFDILVKQFENETFENIEVALNNLDKFYFLAKMHWSQELQVLNIVRKYDYDKRLLKEIKETVEKDENLSNKILFKIYITTNELYDGNFCKDGYYDFKKLILDNLDRFEFKTKKQFLTDLSNYVSYLYGRKPDLEWLKESHEILKIQIKNKCLIVNNQFPEPTYSLGIRVALILEEYEWANDFIKKNSKYIENKVLIKKMEAEVLYMLKDYDKSLDLINTLSLKTFSDNFEMKTLYAKILFDKKQYDLLESHLSTFDLYLRRYKDASEELKDRNLRYVLYLGRLFRNINNSKKIDKLFSDVSEDNLVFNKTWLLSRISLFKK